MNEVKIQWRFATIQGPNKSNDAEVNNLKSTLISVVIEPGTRLFYMGHPEYYYFWLKVKPCITVKLSVVSANMLAMDGANFRLVSDFSFSQSLVKLASRII